MPNPDYPEELEEACTLPDGRIVHLRPIRPEDKPEHYALLERVSSEDRHYRFFASVKTVSHEAMTRFTRIDYDREMAFIASAETDGGGRETLGVVRTIADADGREAEFAILVRSDLKHHGIGRALMEKAIRYAKTRGYSRLMGLVLPDNTAMIAFARHLGFTARRDPGEGVVKVELDLTCD